MNRIIYDGQERDIPKNIIKAFKIGLVVGIIIGFLIGLVL